MRVGILSLIHESNTFSHTPTTLDLFRRDGILTGEAVNDQFRGGFHEISGFLDGLDDAGIDAVPLFYASTPPSGRITRDTCDALIKMMFEQLAGAGPLDGLLVAPHGANAGEGTDYHDLDGFWLTRLRKEVGPGLPIICTIDPHANLSQRMVSACDATIAYRTNPHLDQKQRGLEAASLMNRTLRGEVRPVQAAAFPAVAIGIERQDTSSPPCLPLYEKADARLKEPGVLSDSIVLGFPYADVPEMGSAFIAVTDGDPDLARRIADDLAGYLVAHRDEFVGEFVSIPDAVDAALAGEGPVCLLDMGDNVGGGSAADGTLIAHELLDRGGADAFLCLYDPGCVEQAVGAGTGARLVLNMGGKTDDRHGPSIRAEVRVRGIHEGRFTESAVRHGGKTSFDMGLTAVVTADSGLTVSLTSLRTVPVSLGMMTSIGLDPVDFQVLIAKGVHAPTAAYAPVSRRLIRVDTPGATTADMRRFTYRYRRRPLYPFED
ncbi:MAG: M81 family metallopeptidase [Gemmatimonadetes bacterium]|nr:M81 family metallopeptidase [Gemmatimonadota bacterium]